MLTTKYRKLLNCEEVRCISEKDLALCETKIKIQKLKRKLIAFQNNYNSRYDSKHPIYGNDSVEKLDKVIKGATCRN